MTTQPSPPRRSRFTQQAAATGLASALLVGLSLIISFAPIPFVTWSPGSTIDLLATRDGKPSIEVSGATYRTNGSLLLLTLAQSRSNSLVTLPEAMADWWLPHRDVLPREAVYPGGRSVQEQQSSDVQQMAESQQEAIVAGLRAAGRPVTPVPMVTQITNSGPANGLLRPGDFVSAVDGVATATPEAVYGELQHKAIGSTVVFTVMRNRQPTTVAVPVVGANQDKTIPVVGARFEVGYRYDERITFNIDPNIVGSSGGLMFALAIYDRVTDNSVTAGRVVAGTGRIDAVGTLSAIGGVQEKVAAAESAGASVLLVPTSNCGDLARSTTKLRIVRVSTLAEAIQALHDLKTPDTAEKVPTC